MAGLSKESSVEAVKASGFITLVDSSVELLCVDQLFPTLPPFPPPPSPSPSCHLTSACLRISRQHPPRHLCQLPQRPMLRQQQLVCQTEVKEQEGMTGNASASVIHRSKKDCCRWDGPLRLKATAAVLSPGPSAA